jgi:metal-dependent HD superfamily phosphatase/phosphodiesterase
MVRKDEAVRAYINAADESLKVLGYTEHSFAHVIGVANRAADILTSLGYDEHTVELARIAGVLHDIGNVVNRADHAQSGAILAFTVLREMGADPKELSTVITAIGNHDEHTAFPVNPVAAALIIADKTDVRRTRVRSKDASSFDIHDRVNYSVFESKVNVTPGEEAVIELSLKIDTEMCSVSEYFEIFLERMILCRRSAEVLSAQFHLVINGQRLM